MLIAVEQRVYFVGDKAKIQKKKVLLSDVIPRE